MQNSAKLQDPDQDQRKNGSMEDSPAITIEFLRARLLSERSVSRSARQRADELAKRVMELEEQLKIVSLQRKKAEKATADVFSILKNHEIGEFSEEFDSSSDQEVIHYESKVGNNYPEGESSDGSKIRRTHANEFSGSELESSPLPVRSLSWKSGKVSSCSCEKKYMDSPTRRRSTFASASPRHNFGKSCRQIRGRETRSVLKASQDDNSLLSPQDKGVSGSSEGSPTPSDMGPEILRESSENPDATRFQGCPLSGDLENQRLVAASNYLNVPGGDRDMEIALEHQAQLIGQYEKEEKAQREWEEKYRENDSSTPDSCEPGNQSDITEERDEPKAPALLFPVGTINSEDRDEAQSKGEDASVTKELLKTESSGFQSPPYDVMGCFRSPKASNMLAPESPASDFVFSVATGKQDQQYSANNIFSPSHSYNHSSTLDSAGGHQSANIDSSRAGCSFGEGETSGSKNEPLALIAHETPDTLGSVLQALHQAKLSLRHKLNALPVIDSRSVRDAVGFSAGGRPDVPVGYPGLFRVPSDFHVEAATKANTVGSNSQLRLTYSHLDAGSLVTAVTPFITSPYTESRSSVGNGERHLASPTGLYMESGSNITNWAPLDSWSRFTPNKPLYGSLDTGVPSSNRYACNDPNLGSGLAASRTYSSPLYPFSPDLMPPMPSNEGPRLFSTTGAGAPPPNHFFYNVHMRPNMYR